MVRILFDPSDFKRIINAIRKVKYAVHTRALNISYQMAIDFVKLLNINITSQKYASFYDPYNPRYEEWKSQQGGEMRFWILKSDLIRSLTVWKSRRDWMAGVPAGILDSGSKNYYNNQPPKYIGWYANLMEYGRNRQPERPLFQPSLHEYKNDGAKKRLNESVQIIKRNWK